MELKTLLILMVAAAICVMQVLCLPRPELTDELTRAEASVNSTLESWRQGFESLFQDTNQLDSLLGSLGDQLQTLSESIANLTKNLEESINTTPVPSAS